MPFKVEYIGPISLIICSKKLDHFTNAKHVKPFKETRLVRKNLSRPVSIKRPTLIRKKYSF